MTDVQKWLISGEFRFHKDDELTPEVMMQLLWSLPSEQDATVTKTAGDTLTVKIDTVA